MALSLLGTGVALRGVQPPAVVPGLAPDEERLPYSGTGCEAGSMHEPSLQGHENDSTMALSQQLPVRPHGASDVERGASARQLPAGALSGLNRSL